MKTIKKVNIIREVESVEDELPGNEQSEADVGGIAADRLRNIIERLEHLDEEIRSLREDKKDIFIEAKSAGFDIKVLRIILRIRKLDPNEAEHQDELATLYKRALGM